MRGSLILTALLALALAGAACSDEFLISYWWAPYDLTQEQFAEIAEAGFNVGWFQQQEDQKKILDLCQANGIKAMISDKRLLGKNVGDPEFEKNLDSVIADYSGHPALWGYHVADEPGAGLFGFLGAVNQYLLKKDPRHIPFINLYPTYARDFPGALGTETYEQHVAAFMETVKPRILSYDHYALMGGGERGDYFENMEVIRRYALRHGVPFNYIFLAVPHFGYRDPSKLDMRWQINTALAYGAKGLMYFTYMCPDGGDGVFGPALLDVKANKTPKYYIAKQINSELKTLGPTLMQLTSTGVYHTYPLPPHTSPLPKGEIVESIRGGEFVVGLFRAKNGDRYAMFVNRSFKNEAKAEIVFSQRVKLEELSRFTGRRKSISLPELGPRSEWTTRLRPGEARLVRIEPLGQRF